MKKYLFICTEVILVGAVISCGTRTTEKKHVSVKNDSIYVENSRVLVSKSKLNDILSISPFDGSKPVIIDGITYYNASIVFDKSRFNGFELNEFWKYSEASKEEIKKESETKKTDNTFLYIGLFFVLALFIFLLLYLPKFKIL